MSNQTPIPQKSKGLSTDFVMHLSNEFLSQMIIFRWVLGYHLRSSSNQSKFLIKWALKSQYALPHPRVTVGRGSFLQQMELVQKEVDLVLRKTPWIGCRYRSLPSSLSHWLVLIAQDPSKNN